MEEENKNGDQEPSIWDKVDALTPKKGDVWSQVETFQPDPRKGQLNTILQDGAKRDPQRAARVIRVANRFKLPETFADQNLDRLEDEERKGNLASEDLVNQNPFLAEAITKSPNYSAAALKHLPALKQLEMLYTKPQMLWPRSDGMLQERARSVAKLMAAKQWKEQGGRPYPYDPYSYEGGPTYQLANSQEQMEEIFYKEELSELRKDEEMIKGEGQIGGTESAFQTIRKNPVFFMPLASHLPGILQKADLRASIDAVKNGTGDDVDRHRIERAARLEAAANHRGKSFMGYLGDAVTGFPAMAGEFAIGGSIGRGAKALFGLAGTSLGSKVGGALVESAAGAMTAGVPGAVEVYQQNKLGGQSDVEAAAKAARDAFADYLGNQIFGPWFSKASPEVQALTRKSLLKAVPTEALKMVGQTAASDLMKTVGPDMAEHLKESLVFRAINGDPEAVKELSAQALVGGVSGGLHTAARNAEVGQFTKMAEAYAKASLERRSILEQVIKEFPELATDVSEQLSKAGPHGTTLLPVESLRAYYEKAGVDPRTVVGEWLGDPAKYDHARQSGADLLVPTSVYDRAMAADPKAAEFFANEIRPEPGMANLREAQMLEKAYASGIRKPARERVVEQIVEQARGDKLAEAVGMAELASGDEKVFFDTLGLSDAQLAKIGQTLGKAREYARENLNEREIERRDKLKGALYEKEQARITKEVTKEVDARPEQVALSRLQKHQLPDGTPIPEDAPRIKIAKEFLEGYGVRASDLPRLVTGAEKEGAFHPDHAAELLGLKSGGELISALRMMREVVPNSAEAELRKQLRNLQESRKMLEASREPLEAEAEEAKAELKAGRVTIANRLEKALRAEEHAKVKEFSDALAEIRERGGVRPTVETELLPKKLKAKKGEGVGSDELAQELYDRGIIEDASSDALYDWIRMADDAVQQAKENASKTPYEAKRLSKEKVSASIEALVRNSTEQEQLRQLIARTKAQERDVPIKRTSPREAAIALEIDSRMAKKFPMGLQPSELPQAAEGALHNKHSAELRRLALEYIVENKLTQYQDMIKVASRKVPRLEDVTRSAETDIRDNYTLAALDPKLFLHAEQQAKREAMAAALTGRWEDVFDWRLKELHAHERYRLAQEAIETANKTFGRWKDLPDDGYLNKGVTGEWNQQIKDLLRRIGLVAVDPKDLAGMKPFGEWAKEKLEAGETRFEPINIDPRFANPDFTTTYRDLTYGDFLSLKDTIDRLSYLAKDIDSVHTEAGRVALESWTKEFGDSVKANFKELPPPPLTEAGKNPQEKLVSWARRIDASLDRPESFFDRLDGGKLDGPVNRALWDGQVDARVKYADLRRRFVDGIRKANEEMPAQIRKHLDDKIQLEGVKIPVSRREIMGMVANGGNESNYSKMVRGEEIRRFGLTAEKIQEAAKRLTEAEKDFIQKTLDVTNSFWGEIDALHRWATGRPPEKIQAKQMIEAMGDRPGGYYPAMYDAQYSKVGEIQVGGEIGKLTGPSFQRATTDAGYRNSRIQGFAAPMDYNMGRLASHIDSMAKDIAFRKWLLDANKIVHSPEVMATVRDYLGPEYRDFMRDWVKRVVGSDGASDKTAAIWSKMIGTLRHNAMLASLALKPSVLLKNALGVGPAIAEIGHGWFAKGYQEFLSAPRDTFERMKAESPEMAHFLETYDTNVRESIRRLESKTGALADVQRFAMKVIPIGNFMLTMPTYLGAKAKAIAEYSAQGKTGAELDRLAVRSAEKAVRKTVGSGNPGDIPAVMGSEGMKLLLMFYTPGSVLYSQMKDTVKSGDMSKMLIKGFWLLPFAATMNYLLSARVPDEDRDETYLGNIGKEIVTSPFTAFPMGGNLADKAYDAVTGRGLDYDVDMPAFRALEETFKSVDKGADWWRDEAEFEEVFRQMFRTSGYWFGAPTEQTEITGGYLYDLMRDQADPNDIFEFAHDLLWRRPRSRR
jgi:hypothetical protein